MPVNSEVLKRYPNKYFVETGTNLGDGIYAALDAGFDKIISIEIHEPSYQFAKDRLKHLSQVIIVKGDTSKDLWSYISEINEPITFWLDAHWSGPGTGQGDNVNPIMQEISQIRDHHIKTHKILIDDRRLMGTDDFLKIPEDEIKKAILTINPSYIFGLEDGFVQGDILTCTARDDVVTYTF
jgi:hypothetical protein